VQKHPGFSIPSLLTILNSRTRGELHRIVLRCLLDHELPNPAGDPILLASRAYEQTLYDGISLWGKGTCRDGKNLEFADGYSRSGEMEIVMTLEGDRGRRYGRLADLTGPNVT
jgi:hypothetical protein